MKQDSNAAVSDTAETHTNNTHTPVSDAQTQETVERIPANRVEVIPKHGNGRLQTFAKGVSGNPGGKSTEMRQALVALREWHGKRGASRLIELAESEDERVASVCTLAIWDRVAGKVKDKPDESAARAIDWSKLTPEQRDLVRAALLALAGASDKPAE